MGLNPALLPAEAEETQRGKPEAALGSVSPLSLTVGLSQPGPTPAPH